MMGRSCCDSHRPDRKVPSRSRSLVVRLRQTRATPGAGFFVSGPRLERPRGRWSRRISTRLVERQPYGPAVYASREALKQRVVVVVVAAPAETGLRPEARRYKPNISIAPSESV